LNVELSLSEAFNSQLPAEFRSFVSGNDQQFGSASTMFSAAADYARNRHRVQLFGRGSTYFRYAPGFDHIAAVSQDGALGASFRLPHRGNLQIAQTATYSPPYLYDLFPTAAPPPLGQALPVNAAYRTDSYQYRTTAALAFGSPRTTQVTTTADYSFSDFRGGIAAPPDLATYGVGAKVARALSRSGGVSLDYHYQTGDFGVGGDTKEHRVAMGVNYSAPLSKTRRMNLRLDVTPSVIESRSEPGSVEERTSHMQGEVAIEFPFRPKWRVEASYRRSVEYVPGLSEPALTSGTTLRLNGAVGRRVDLLAMAGYANATSAVPGTERNLGTYTGQARITYPLTRTWSVYSEYLYSTYDLGQLARFAPGLPSVYEQHEIRVGLTVLARVLGR
jgi:predicted porin